ncbi:MAG: phage terminase large subunit family protein [Pirellulaceae bacterium]
MPLTSTNVNFQPSRVYSEFEKISRVEAHDLTLEMIDNCMSQELRDLVTFAEECIVLPKDGGPFQGQPFLADNQPYVRLLYYEIKHGLWSEIIVTGPSQSGKTLSAFVIVVLYIAVELRKNVVVGVPDLAMINDKWKVDFLPVLQESPALRGLLPRSGAGSKGGTIQDMVQLTNGVTIRFMTRGGSDQSKAGFTASHVVVTEAAGWSDGTESSKESDPLRQLRARQRATSRFDEDGKISTERQMIVEGTVTDEFDLPWRAKAGSSESQLVYQCVHCSEYVRPEREHFIGWQEANSEFQAAKLRLFHMSEMRRGVYRTTAKRNGSQSRPFAPQRPRDQHRWNFNRRIAGNVCDVVSLECLGQSFLETIRFGRRRMESRSNRRWHRRKRRCREGTLPTGLVHSLFAAHG